MTKPLYETWDELEETFEQTFGKTTDFVKVPVLFNGRKCWILYYSSLVGSSDLSSHLTLPFNLHAGKSENLEQFRATALASLNYMYINDWSMIARQLNKNSVCILAEGEQEALTVEIGGYAERSLSEPVIQPSIFGPKIAFTESVVTNISILRRILRTKSLQIESYDISSDMVTGAVLVYLEDVIEPELLQEAKRRIQSLEGKKVTTYTHLMEELRDNKKTNFFPTLMITERQDACIAQLMEGRAVVFIDGSPSGIILPAVFQDFFRSSEDAYLPRPMMVFLRVLRYCAFFISLLLPGIYIGVINYNYEIIPINLAIEIAGLRSNLPFPSVIELLLVEAAFEIMREGSIRMPKIVGNALTVVGALVIGDAAVQAGIVSIVVIIVVAFTGLSSYAFPYYNFAFSVRLLRFIFIGVASILGIYGVFLGCIILFAYLVNRRSFGYPYLQWNAKRS
ncbi:spore germination protein [Paenibacillus sp. JDR-2]|uniref:spore germination protein n=1 Tax=Paenibacillus sp. (strain JDR-2) TaxID=324057 RepID=UPI00016695DE|nr:spore germination protein [Paenibacillus sp. JDR-2]ACT01615.1 GerA spore germination protein [Paenibacillus sp. JDR-2]